MENKLISKLRVPSTVTLATQKPVSSISTSGMPKYIPKKFRRSKSYNDLATATFKLAPSRVLKPLLIQRNPIAVVSKPQLSKPTASKPVPIPNLRKRPIEEKSSLETKNKVSKPVKPAPYDYKARYTLLSEKYTLVLASRKDAEKGLTEALTETGLHKSENQELCNKLVTLKNKFELLTQAFKTSEEANEASKDRQKALELENAGLLSRIGELETSLCDRKHELDSLKTAFSSLSKSHDESTIEVRRLKGDHERALKRIDFLDTLVLTYKEDLRTNENLRRVLHNNVQDLKGNIRVFCRVRPSLEGEDDRNLINFNFPDECNIELKKRESISSTSGRPNDLKQEFVFDKVFTPDSSQSEVFKEISQLVQSALDGYNICVFAYGQTGSGKTYTMQGNNDNLGMTPRTIELLYETIDRLKRSGWTYQVQACFMEIYNESIRDLLGNNMNKSHDIRYNDGKGVTITNLQVETIDSAVELKDLMYRSQKNRAVAATNYNEHSSRSHSVTKIILEGFHKDSQAKYQGSINLVDLAGSESAKTSHRLAETKNINKSLSTLGNVMLALHNKDPHVPYRNSKLTYLLQSCLGGNSKTLMFVNISPLEDSYAESINSLRFAAKVKEVKIGSKVNRVYQF